MSGPHRFLFSDAPGGSAVLAELRRLQHRQLPDAASEPDATCELCGKDVSRDHRHLLQTDERRILCACESCWAMRSGDPGHRPVGTRTLWLDDFTLDDALWTRLRIPIGLAFFFRSAAAGRVVALYPGALGATEAEPDEQAWAQLVSANPLLETLEVDAEALIVNRLDGARQAAIVPIDRCYALVGRIKQDWEGIQGGRALDETVPGFFEALREQAATP